MKKLMLCLGSLLAISTSVYAAEDTVTALIGAQTYKCVNGKEVVCSPVNELKQQEVVLKKDGRTFSIAVKTEN